MTSKMVMDMLLTLIPTTVIAVIVGIRALRLTHRMDKLTNATTPFECIICLRGAKMLHTAMALSLLFLLCQYYWFFDKFLSGCKGLSTIHWLWLLFDIGVFMFINTTIQCFQALLDTGMKDCKEKTCLKVK